VEKIGTAPKVEYPDQGDAEPAAQSSQRNQGQHRGSQIAICGWHRESGWQPGRNDTLHQECKPDKSETVQEEERTQGIPARLGAKERAEEMTWDETPSAETKGDANSEQRLRRHVLLLSVSCANPLNPSLAIGGTADIDGYGRLGRLGLDANDVCLSAFSFSLVG